MARLALVLLGFLAACGGSATERELASTAESQGPPSPEVTLDDAGCSHDAAGPAPSDLRISVRNQATTGPANFELVRLNGSFDEADRFLADVRSGIEPAPGELPFIAEEADRSFVAPGLSGQLTAKLTPGTYAVVCVALDENDDIITAYVAGPFVVTE